MNTRSNHKGNALIRRSEQARAVLQADADMDDLDYQLMVFEAGCAALDDMVRPVNAVDPKLGQEYREQLTNLGWWTWWELEWRRAEIRISIEWMDEESLVSLQTPFWKRARLLTEAKGLRKTKQYQDSFELWLKILDDTLPKLNNQPQHASH